MAPHQEGGRDGGAPALAGIAVQQHATTAINHGGNDLDAGCEHRMDVRIGIIT